MNQPPDAPTADMFEPLVNSEFKIYLDDETTLVATLKEVTRLPPSTTCEDLPIRKDPFSLIFKIENQPQLEQRTYKVENESNGAMNIFLVPVGFGEYQAIYN